MSLFNHKLAVMARREFWEHRSLWMAPAIVGALMVVLPLVAGVNFGEGRGINFNPGPADVSGGRVPNIFGQASMIGIIMTLGGVAALAAFAYLLDCLYGERKDRSILFWKSLPVSDAQTVLVKLAVGVVLTPLIAIALAVVVHLLTLGTMYLRFEELHMAIGGGTILGGWKILPAYVTMWLFGLLWYLPVIGWLMLASVLAKRAPMVYALMPPLVLVMVEGMVMQERRVLRFLGDWLFPWTRSDWAWDFDPSRAAVPGLHLPDWSVLFTNLSTWICAAVGAAMIYGVIRLRRYRDDT